MSAAKKSVTENRFNLSVCLNDLVAAGVVSTESAQMILRQSSSLTEYPLFTIARYGLKDLRSPHLPLTIDRLLEWLAAHCGVKYFEIDPLKIDLKSIVQILPTNYLRRWQILPVKIEATEVLVATADPLSLDWIEQVQNVTGKHVNLTIANPKSIAHFIEEFATVRSATKDFRREQAEDDFGNKVLELNRMLSKASGNEIGKDAAAVIRIVDWLFQFAHDERATDIHLEPRKGKGVVRFRIDGRMRAVYSFDPHLMVPVVTRMKLLSEMQIDEKRKPQDGRIRYKLSKGEEMEMRLSTIPAQHGEKMVVRIFDAKMVSDDFTTLGFTGNDIAKWEGLVNLAHGLVLVTGPTGSGKSTTLHTSMRKVAREDVNICTIEDPIEIVNDDLNQVQVNTKIELTFGEAIRAFLRQDPDIMMVGEIRDTDAARMAIQAALTGHLVLSTLHTNDALSSITRLIDLGVPSHLVAASLRGMMAQRLVRKLCEFCKEKVPTPFEGWTELVGEHSVAAPSHVYAPVGCRECKHTGYRGRTCVYEIIVMDREIKSAIGRNVTFEALAEAADGKFTPLQLNGVQKVIDGVTSIEEVLRAIY